MAGQVAMISRGHWIVQNAKTQQAQHGHRHPADEGERHDGHRLRRLCGVTRRTANADLAKALVLELTSEETQKEEGERGGGVPGRKSAAETAGVPRLPAERRALLPDAAAHQGRALACQLPGSREDLHPLLHRDDGRRGVDRRRRASRPTPSSTDSFARLKQRWAADARSSAPRPAAQRVGARAVALRSSEREMTSMATTTAKRHVSDLRRAQARTGYLFVLPTIAALPDLRAGAGGPHRHPELRLLRPDARLALGRLRQLHALLHRPRARCRSSGTRCGSRSSR